jgi:hypothetical protein
MKKFIVYVSDDTIAQMEIDLKRNNCATPYLRSEEYIKKFTETKFHKMELKVVDNEKEN